MRTSWRTGANVDDSTPTDLFEGRTLLELRVLRFQRLELALQLVVLAVGDLRFVAVVALAVVPDELRQRGGAVERLRRNAVLRLRGHRPQSTDPV